MLKLRVRFTFTAILFLLFSYSSAQMSGTYTINPSITASATNYLTFQSAVFDLMAGFRPDGGPAQGPGVNGAVTINVEPGTYNESVEIGNINGVSVVNTVTFNGQHKDSVKVTSAGTGSGSFTWKFNGCRYVKVHNLTIENTGSSYGHGVMAVNQANHNEVKNCRVSLPTTATSYYQTCVLLAPYYSTTGSNANDFNFENNEVSGGRIAIAMNGTSTAAKDSNNVFKNNTFVDYYYYGVYMRYQRNAVFEGNTFTQRSGYTSGYGMYNYYCDAYTVTGNVFNNIGYYGVYLYRSNYLTTSRSTFTNNMIGGGFQSTSTCYGIRFYYADKIDFWNNSILTDNASTGYAMYYYYSNGCDIRNNSIANNCSGGYAAYFSGSYSLTALNYNNYFTNSSNIAYHGTTYSNLTAWQLGQSSYNGNSKEGWPNYISATNLHSFGAQLNNSGLNSIPVNVDIDGQTRPLAPDPTKDIGADEFNVPPYDLDITAITSPTVLVVGPNVVAFEAMNMGSNSLNGVGFTAQYSTDGGTTWPVTQAFLPTTLGTPGNSQVFTFTTPANISTAGTYNICVRFNPSVSGDPDALDQMCVNVCTGMAGNYTINSSAATSGTNFNTFTDAAAALSSCGVSGPVYITVLTGANAGVYQESFTLGTVPGVSSVNTVTFDGVNSSNITVTDSFTTTNQSIITLDGTDYITFKNLTILNKGNYGYGVKLSNQASYNQIKKCVINTNSTVYSSYNVGVLLADQYYYSYGDNGDYNKIDSCEIINYYYGVRLNGTSSSVQNTGNEITNCYIHDFYYYGIYSYYQSNTKISGNRVEGGLNSSTNSYGIYTYYNDGAVEISKNAVNKIGSRGIYVYYCNNTGIATMDISNNMIGGAFMGTGYGYGLYMYGSKKANIYHNSVYMDLYQGYVFYLSGSASTGHNIKNNIFQRRDNANNAAYCMYVASSSYLNSIGNNDYYAEGTNYIYFQGSHTTLAGYQTFVPMDQNSVAVDANFLFSDDLHVGCSPVDGLGTPVGISDDIDDQTRSTTAPDIGADEFTPPPAPVLSLGADTMACDTFMIWSDSTWKTWDWKGGLSTSNYMTVDSTDTYWLTVTDSLNCVATDTITVTINPLPSYVYSGDTISQCMYDSLNAQNPGHSYLWSTSDTSQMIVPPALGTYTVDITSPQGCSITDQVTVEFYAQPVVNLGPDTSYCLGGSTQLDAGANVFNSTYNWSTGASTQVVVITAPGTYSVVMTSPDGCVGTDTVNVNAKMSPVVNLGPDRQECGSFVLDAQNPGDTYQWSNSASSQTITATSSGTYWVTVTNSQGCSTTDSVAITVVPAPVQNLGPDQIVCNGSTVTLDAGNAGMQYSWSTGASTQTITVSTAGTYIVEVIDPTSNCSTFDTVQVTQSNLNVNLGPDFNLCDGKSAVLNAGTAGTNYLWNTGATSTSITITTGGTYTVTVTDANNCQAVDDVVVGTLPGVGAAFSSVSSVPMFSTLNLTDNSTGNPTSWVWDFGDGSPKQFIQNASYAYSSLGTYTITLIANNGACSDTTTQQITVTDPVGINDEVLEASLEIYPNPSNGLFQIGFDLLDRTDVKIDIMNINGQTIYSKLLIGVLGHTESVDISGSAAGIYFLRIQTAEGREVIKKLMID